jgi:hypothetical protein
MSVFSLQRILPVLLASAFTCGSVGAQEGADKLSAVELEKLDSLRLDYDLAREEIQQKQWVEPMEKLRSAYKAKMKQVQDNFAQSGDLKKALAARTAIKTDPTAATINAAVKEIASVQRIFTNTQKRMQEKLKQSLTQLARSYVTQLTAIKDKLTKDKRLDSALSIDDEIQKFVAALSLLTIDDLRKPSLNSGSSKKLKDGLVAYYPFNGNAKDESGSGNNFATTPALGADRSGVAEASAAFNSPDPISSPNLTLNGQNLSTSLWVRLDTSPSKEGERALMHGSANARNGLFSLAFWGDGRGEILIRGSDHTSKAIRAPAGTFSLKRWYNITFTGDENTLNFYIDGTLYSSIPANLATFTAPLVLAGENQFYFDSGRIDDIRIYNRALSAKEVSAIYDSEKPVSNELKKSLGVTKFPQRPLPSFSDKPNPVSDYQWEVINGKVTIVKFIGGGGKVVIPNRIDAKPVTSIGTEAFFGCKSLTSITIGNGVTSIGEKAFNLCNSLTSITIPESVTSIGEYAFNHCNSLTSITIGNGVTSIGEKDFWGCVNLTAVTFLGDAPKAEGPRLWLFTLFATPTIYRKPEAKGWGDTFGGRPVKLISEKP